MASAKLTQLQLVQQNLQHLLGQKQQLEGQLIELDSALTELKTTEKAYKIVGKIMIAASRPNLLKEISEKKEVITLRLGAFSQQEEKLKQNIESLQKEVLEDLKSKK